MTSKERILKILEGKIPDRIPLFEIWIDENMVSIFRGEDLQNTYVKLGLDCIMLPYHIPQGCNSWKDGVDEWGIKWHKGHYKDGLVKTDVDLKKYSPSLDFVDKFFDEFEIKKSQKKFLNFSFIFGSHIGPFTAAGMSMGYEQFFLDLLDRPSFIHKVLEKRTEWCIAMYKRAIEFGADVVILGDDAADSRGPLISKELWRKFVFPYHCAIVQELDAPIIWHSDGYIVPLLPMAIEAGFIGIHGLEPNAGMNLAKIKKEFGNDLIFIGNADVNNLFSEDLEVIRDEVRRCVDQGAPGGGYMFSSCNSIFEGMNPTAIMEMYSYAKKIGHY